MQRVLILGATGFIGQQMVRYLSGLDASIARALSIRCFVRASSNRESLRDFDLEYVSGSLDDEESLFRAVQDCDAVVNFAGTTKVLHRAAFQDANVLGVERIAAACARQPSPPTLIHISSLAAAGPSLPGKPRLETDAPAPVSHYGRSKLEGEQRLSRFRDQVPISVVRPPIVLGPGDRDGLELFRSISKFGVHLIPGFSEQEVSVVHSEDLCRGIFEVLDRGERLGDGVGDGVYFIADAQTLTYSALGDRIANALSRRPPWKLRCPLAGIWAVASINEFVARFRRRPHILNFDKAREAAAGTWTCANEKIASELSFRCEASVDQRLIETATWYREHAWL